MFYIASKILNILVHFLYFISGNKLPQFVGISAIIQNEKNEFLVQKRADKKGFCLPGGLTTVGETLEDGIKREVFEETGFKITEPQFLFYTNVNKRFRYGIGMIFSAKVLSGELKDSWEGQAMWKAFDEIKDNMAFEHDKVIERYLKGS